MSHIPVCARVRAALPATPRLLAWTPPRQADWAPLTGPDACARARWCNLKAGRTSQLLVLFAADLHGRQNLYRWLGEQIETHHPDLVVLAGDLLGRPAGYATREAAQRVDAGAVLAHLDAWAAPTWYVMGNCDRVELPARPPRIQSLHERRLVLGDTAFVGYQTTTPFTGGPFEKPEEGIESDLARLGPLLDEHTVLITHGPAYGILDKNYTGARTGSVALRKLVDSFPFRVHVHGHIHEAYGSEGRHFNVAAAGIKRALLLDVSTMEHRLIGG